MGTKRKVKITVEQPGLSEAQEVEGIGFFGILDVDEGGYGLMVGGYFGADLLMRAVGETSRQLVAMYGPEGGFIALKTMLDAIGDDDGIDDMASKLSAAHEAAVAIVGEEAAER